MPKRFVYGHQKEGKGAGFIVLDEELKAHCSKYTGFKADARTTRVNFDPVSEDLYILAITTKLPEGSSYDSRGQIFVDGYGFSKEEIDFYMKEPEKFLDFKYFESPDDYTEKKKVCLREQSVTGQNKVHLPEVMEDVYFGSIMDNTEHMKTQILHIIDPFVPEKWQHAFVGALKVLPLEVRRTISFCINPYTVEEMNNSEWNFISPHVYKRFVDSDFDGGKLLDRVVLTENGTKLEGNAIANPKLWEEYCKRRKEISAAFRKSGGNRKELKRLTEQEVVLKDETTKSKTKSTKMKSKSKTKDKSQLEGEHKPKSGRANVLQLIVAVTETLTLFACGAFLAAQFAVKVDYAAQYISVRVEISVLVFLVQCVFACLVASLAEKVRRLMKAFRKKGK